MWVDLHQDCSPSLGLGGVLAHGVEEAGLGLDPGLDSSSLDLGLDLDLASHWGWSGLDLGVAQLPDPLYVPG